MRCRSRHPSASCLFATGFKRAALAGLPRRTVTRNLKPIASRTLKTVVKFGFFGSPANAMNGRPRTAVSVSQRNHDPDQDGRSTAAQGICAVSCLNQFLLGPFGTLSIGLGRLRQLPVVWRSTAPMKCCLAVFAIAASLFAPVAHANDALEAKVRAYVPVYPSSTRATSGSMPPPRTTTAPCSRR